MTRVPPPVLGLVGVGTQVALTAAAGGRRRFPGQRVATGLVGAGALALSAAALGLFHRAGTTPNPMEPSQASTLVTDGVYRYTRNPMYLAILVELLAVAVGTGRLRSLLALPGVVWALQPQIEAEEAALTKRFGVQYTSYCAQVPRWV